MRESVTYLEASRAAGHLLERAAAMSRRRPHVAVGITGPAGAGKSHLARALSTCVLATDDYLPDYDTTPEHLRDLPESSDLARLAGDLSSLASGRTALVPIWSFAEHRRVGQREVRPEPVIVCEGLHALHAAVRGALDLMVFVEAPQDVRWRRVEHREREGQRGWTIEYARHFFQAVAEPTYARYEPEYRHVAHVVVRNAGFEPGVVRAEATSP